MVRIEMGAGSDAGGRAGRPRDPRLDGAIVAATVELLVERGYHDTTLAAVAERAGTTTAAIYRRFGSKSDLVTQAVFRTEGDDVVADTGDLAADLATMVRWSIEKLSHPAALAALAGLLGERRSDAATRTTIGLAVHRVRERLERAKAAGELRPDADTRVLTSMISGPVTFAAIGGMASQLDDAWVTAQVSLVLDGARPRSTSTGRRGGGSRSDEGPPAPAATTTSTATSTPPTTTAPTTNEVIRR